MESGASPPAPPFAENEPRRTGVEVKRSDAPLRVLHVVAPAALGGLERVVHGLTRGLVERGHAITVATVLASPQDTGFVSTLRTGGVTVQPLVVRQRGYLEERRRIRGLIEELGVSIVHTHGFRPDVIDSGVARRLGVATISTVHGFTGGGWRVRAYERTQIAMLRRFDAVVAVSSPLAESLRRSGVSGSRVHTIRNAWVGVDSALDRRAARSALGLAPDGFVIGWVGRMGAEKDPLSFVDGLAMLSDLPLHAVAIGDGPMLEPARARARVRHISERLHLPGNLPNAGSLFAAFDLFVMTSRTEGTPIVLLEAMAAGVPIVATEVGGIPELLGGTGILVPPKSPAALASALRTIIQNEERAAGLAQAGRERLRLEFAIGPWVAAYEALYRSLAGVRQAHAGRPGNST